MKRHPILIFCSTTFLIASSSLGFNYSAGFPAQEASKPPFRYIIFTNQVEDDPSDPKKARRVIELLLDAKAFSEETLKTLFKRLMKKYPEPEWMEVGVHTSLEQIDPPDTPKMSEAPYDPDLDKYHRAFMIRENGNELIRYNPNPPDPYRKTVILKGKDPFAPQEK